MRHPHTLAARLAASLLLASSAAAAQADQFRFQPDRVPVGKMFQYEKSQRDGTHATRISVFVPSVDRVESLKWDEGGDRATLVVATMDWATFSVRAFRAFELRRGAATEPRAALDVDGDELRASFTTEALKLHHWPWHSYDFDFTSLSLALPHLRAPGRSVTFWRTDFVYEDPPRVAELGEVSLEYQGRETRQGRAVRRYEIGGAGLEGKSGHWWTDARSGLMVEFELPIGDEPGYRDVRMSLDHSRAMTPQEWEDFKREAVGGS